MRWLATVADSPELATQITENIENVTQPISKTQEYLDKYLPVAIGFGLRLLLTVLLFLVGSRLIKLCLLYTSAICITIRYSGVIITEN